MRTMLLALTMLCTSIFVAAQNLSIDQIISIRTKSIADVKEYLTARDWTLHEASEASEGKMGKAIFAYGKSSYDNKATAWLYFYKSNIDSKLNRIDYQVHNNTKYNSLLARVKALGFTLSNSSIKDGVITKIYKKTGIVKEISSSTQEDTFTTKTVYNFTIYNALDYSLNFEEE